MKELDITSIVTSLVALVATVMYIARRVKSILTKLDNCMTTTADVARLEQKVDKLLESMQSPSAPPSS